MFFMRMTLVVMSRLIEFDLKNEIFAKYQDLSLAFYKRNNTGDLMARIHEDVSKVRMYLGPAILYAVNLSVLVVLIIANKLNCECNAHPGGPDPTSNSIVYHFLRQPEDQYPK